MKRNSISAWMLAGLGFAFLYAPIVVVIVFSFNAARFGVGWSGFTAKWYRALFENSQAMAAAKNTLLLAGASTGIATVLGTMLGYGLGRYRFAGRNLVRSLLAIPVFIPDIAVAVGLLFFYSLLRQWLGWFEPGLTTMIVGHVTFQTAFVAIVVRSRLEGQDPVLEEAAHDLGANGRQVFWHVTLPLLVPAILAGAILALTLSLDDFVVSFFTSGPGSTTLPIWIYSSVKRGVTPEINALSTLMVAVSVAGSLAAVFLRRRWKGRENEIESSLF